jgi:hypothetical protein
VELDEEHPLPNPEACRRWISSFPGLAKHVKVEGVYHGYSTVLVISIPIVIWNTLPEHPACQPITYVTSRNLLQDNSSLSLRCDISTDTPSTSMDICLDELKNDFVPSTVMEPIHMQTVPKPPPNWNPNDGGPMSKADGTDGATIRTAFRPRVKKCHTCRGSKVLASVPSRHETL